MFSQSFSRENKIEYMYVLTLMPADICYATQKVQPVFNVSLCCPMTIIYTTSPKASVSEVQNIFKQKGKNDYCMWIIIIYQSYHNHILIHLVGNLMS